MAGPPILVTGSHRSGTTWIGALLAASGEAMSVHEPFNPTYSRTWLRRPADHWFQLIADHDAGEWRDQVGRIVDLRPAIGAMLRRSRSWRDVGRVAEQAVLARRHRAQQHRVILKDPIALASAPWIADEFDVDVIVLVRHPAAFVSSILRLDWRFDFRNLIRQPALLDGRLAALASEVREAAAQPLPLIDNAMLSWRVLNTLVAQYRDERTQWLVARHEDVASVPEEWVPKLYAHVGLAWTAKAQVRVRRLTSGDHRGDVPDGDKGGVERNSRATVSSWRRRLTPEQIAIIREGTADVAAAFYDDGDWPSAE